MSEISLSAIERIIRKGSGLRVSNNAAKALGELLELEGEKISRQSAEYARHAKRKTVTAEDIKLAARK